jgi:hypothetical protein
MSNITEIENEITIDPLARGYAAMTNLEVLQDMSIKNRVRNKTSLTGSEVLNAIPKADLFALPTVELQRMWNVVHLGNVNPFGIEADILIDIFGAGSATITTLAAIRKEIVSRAVELGIILKKGYIEQARRDV